MLRLLLTIARCRSFEKLLFGRNGWRRSLGLTLVILVLTVRRSRILVAVSTAATHRAGASCGTGAIG